MAICFRPTSLDAVHAGVRRAPRHGVVMMARASSLRTDQMRRAKNAAPVIMSGKEKKKAKHDRRMRNREKFASSGRRLIKLNQEDESSFYIGFVGMNRAGRAQALRSVESFLKKATELKVRVTVVHQTYIYIYIHLTLLFACREGSFSHFSRPAGAASQ